MSFTHPYSHKHCIIKRRQIPLLPAFALTAHKVQAQTLDKAIIDLNSTWGTESPYVMISHVRSISDLLILRPFSFSRISSQQSQELREEMTRLEQLHEKTFHQSETNLMPYIVRSMVVRRRKHKRDSEIDNNIQSLQSDHGDVDTSAMPHGPMPRWVYFLAKPLRPSNKCQQSRKWQHH